MEGKTVRVFVLLNYFRKNSLLYYCFCALICFYGLGSTLSLAASHLHFLPVHKASVISQTRGIFSDLQWVNSAIPSSEIWSRVRNRFHINAPTSTALLHRHVRLLARDQSYINELVNNASPYLFYVVNEVEKRGMPAEIALLPMIESEFNPHCKSNKGASGLWQIMPTLGRIHGLKQNSQYDGRRDVYESTKVALDHLQYLHKKFNGNWPLALAAYNAGETKVMNAMKKNRSANKSTDYWSLKLPKETTHFVPKLLAVSTIIKSPQRYGVKLPAIQDKPVFTRVHTPQALNIAHAAKMADVPEKQLRKLNPGLNKKADSTPGPINLVVPIHGVQGIKNKVNAATQLSDAEVKIAKPTKSEVKQASTKKKAGKKKSAKKKAIKKKSVKKKSVKKKAIKKKSRRKGKKK
jgi:membrane-bound lytic murein transglycosylase D